MSLQNMSFADLEPGMRIFHLEDEAFGEILKVDAEDEHWLMVEVKWDNEDPTINDTSYVLGGARIAVVVESGTPMMTTIMEAMGDKIAEVEEEHGSDFSILNIVNPW